MENVIDVLILEDNADDLGLIKRELKKLEPGVTIREVNNGDNYSAQLSERVPDIVLSDFRIPGYSGDSAFDDLRSVSKEIPFILVSGTVGEEKAVELMKRGISDFIPKDKLSRLVPAVEREIKDLKSRIKAAKDLNELILYREIFKNSNDSVCILDSDGVILSHNLADERLMGYTIEELKGKTPAIFFGEENFRKNLDTARREGRFSGQITVQSKTGEEKTIQVNLIRITDSSGNIKFACIKHDMTEIKAKENELIKKAETLQEVNSVMIGRELKMIELKKEVNELLKSLGKPEKYEI